MSNDIIENPPMKRYKVEGVLTVRASISEKQAAHYLDGVGFSNIKIQPTSPESGKK